MSTCEYSLRGVFPPVKKNCCGLQRGKRAGRILCAAEALFYDFSCPFIIYNEEVEDEILIPAGRMEKTEKNLQRDPRIKLTICNRQVEGLSYKGTGFFITGTVRFVSQDRECERIKARFLCARAALVVKILSAE